MERHWKHWALEQQKEDKANKQTNKQTKTPNEQYTNMENEKD